MSKFTESSFRKVLKYTKNKYKFIKSLIIEKIHFNLI